MKKRLLFLCVLLGFMILAQAQNRREMAYLNNEIKKVSKYKGFIDIGGGFGVGEYGRHHLSFQTSHGYQFNPYFYLGAGVGFDYFTRHNSYYYPDYSNYHPDYGYQNSHIGWNNRNDFSVPIFANIRITLNKPITPFFDVKIGYSTFDGMGVYFNPNFGISFKLNGKTALNLGAGYNMQMADIYHYSYNGYYDYDNYNKEIMGAMSFKFGVEF